MLSPDQEPVINPDFPGKKPFVCARAKYRTQVAQLDK